jgi:hypothetical protein
MSATTLVSPTTYSNNSLPPYTGWPAPSPTHKSGLISPPESRRTSDNMNIKEPPPPISTAHAQHRQSLPSIHEALSSSAKPNPYSSPVSATIPHSQHTLPYSQGPSVPRSYPQDAPTFAAQQRHSSPPQPVHPQANPFGRSDAIPASFAEARHASVTSLQTAPVAPPNPYAGRPFEPPRFEQDPRAPERMSNGYTHQPPQPQGQYPYPAGAQMPPSGRHPSFTEPRYQPRDNREPVDAWKRDDEKYPQSTNSVFKVGLKRDLDVWDFENNLTTVSVSPGPQNFQFLTCSQRSISVAVSSQNGLVITIQLHKSNKDPSLTGCQLWSRARI